MADDRRREVACSVQLCNAPVSLMELHGTKRVANPVATRNRAISCVERHQWCTYVFSRILTNIVGRAENFADVRAVADVPRDTKIAELHVTVGKLAGKDQILRLKREDKEN